MFSAEEELLDILHYFILYGFQLTSMLSFFCIDIVFMVLIYCVL